MRVSYIFAFIAIGRLDAQVPTASISSHVLDISGGSPAKGVQILSYIQKDDAWEEIGNQFTEDTGRVDWIGKFPLVAGTYRLVFVTKPYYDARNVDSFYPYIEVVFTVKDATQHYHVPITLSPWGYSTYRGS